MVWVKRIGIVIAVVAPLIAAGVFFLKRHAETYSFAQEAPEQAQLAAEHAECVGYYMVMRTSLNKERSYYAEREKEYTSELEHHAEMGFNFSPDKDKFKLQIEEAVSQFKEQAIAATEKEKVPELVDKKMKECFDTVFRSVDFVKRKLQEKIQHH